mgnify:CR=1 FL=1
MVASTGWPRVPDPTSRRQLPSWALTTIATTTISSTLQAHNHFPHHHDKEAYSDAIPPSPSECDRLTAFSDACWGGQIGNSVPDGTPLELFKLRSLSGHIICRAGGPISWKCLRQDHTALSSAEAEIIATNECIKEVLSIRNRAEDIDIVDATDPTPVYNDNRACVDWAATATTKGIKHLNLRENRVREAHATAQVMVKHIPGALNSSDLLTKELKDAALYRKLRDTIMVSKANFLRHHHTVPAHMAAETAPSSPSSANVVTKTAEMAVHVVHVDPEFSSKKSEVTNQRTYADVLSEGLAARSAARSSQDIASDLAARGAAHSSRIIARFATERATTDAGQTVIRPSCQSLPSQGGVEVGHRKNSSRQIHWWDSPSHECVRHTNLNSSQ